MSKLIEFQKAILRIREVEAVVGLKKSTIYALIKQGKFPPSKKIVPGATVGASGWDADLVYAWAKSRMAGA